MELKWTVLMAISWCQQLSLMSAEMVCTDPPVVVQFVYCALTTASMPIMNDLLHSNPTLKFIFSIFFITTYSHNFLQSYQKNLEMKALP